MRIDVTSPQRVDLALSEGHKRFAHRNPDLEAKWLRMAEAFVRGEKSSRERTHSDSLFQINASARQRGAPWDLIRLRVSVPGDITGALSVHRILDLAPQSEESRLFAGLAEQETVRLRWVTEGVELLYRLPPEHRDYMREAVATNERRTDEERHARYEELLAWGMATMSELPFLPTRNPASAASVCGATGEPDPLLREAQRQRPRRPSPDDRRSSPPARAAARRTRSLRTGSATSRSRSAGRRLPRLRGRSRIRASGRYCGPRTRIRPRTSTSRSNRTGWTQSMSRRCSAAAGIGLLRTRPASSSPSARTFPVSPRVRQSIPAEHPTHFMRRDSLTSRRG